MSETVTLALPNHVAQSARSVAARTNRCVEDVLLEWIGHAEGRVATDLPIGSLTDDEVLQLCEMQLADEQQMALSALLAGQREGVLTDDDRSRLDALMMTYRRGLVQKAQALEIAVGRGLRPPLNAD